MSGGRSGSPVRRPAGADLFRVLSVLVVAWFHIWQQTWLTPPGRLEAVVRTGYLWVDHTILLSGFCLYLPYACDRAEGLAFRGTRGFWRRRAMRILPAYWLVVLLGAAVHLSRNPADRWFWEDLLMHLTLTQNFSVHARLNSALGGALWTVEVLAGFYLLFPLLVRLYRRCCGLALALAGAVQLAATAVCFALPPEGAALQMLFNTVPAFMFTFCLGMAGADLYSRCAGRGRGNAGRLLWLGALPLCLWGSVQFAQKAAAARPPALWQITWRIPWSLWGLVLLLALCLGLSGFQSRALAFLAGLSYPFYLCHQQLAVWLKYVWHIPFWSGQTPPNQLGDTAWSRQYGLLCWAGAVLLSLGVWLAAEGIGHRLRKVFPLSLLQNGRK